MVAAAHRADDRCPARNDQRLSEGRGHRGAGPRTPPRITSETGHFHRLGVHRLWWRKSGHFRGGVDRLGSGESGHQGGGVHRLGSGPASGSRAECERVRAVSRADRRGAPPRPQRHGDLAGPRRRSRLHRAVCERAPLCRDAPRDVVAGGARRDHDRTGRGSPGRLRRGPDGPSSRTRASIGARASSS